MGALGKGRVAPYLKQIASGDLLCDTGSPTQCSVTTLGGGTGREMAGVQKGGTYVSLWLTHVDVWQRPAQYCKAVALQ